MVRPNPFERGDRRSHENSHQSSGGEWTALQHATFGSASTVPPELYPLLARAQLRGNGGYGSLRACKNRGVQTAPAARWESMRRLAESLIKASELSGSPS